MSRAGDRTITFRLPEHLFFSLEEEAKPQKLSPHQLAKRYALEALEGAAQREEFLAAFDMLGNALDHMGSVERPVVRVDVKTLPDSYQITVSDNGKGIDPAHHDRIFEIFQSLGSCTDGRRGTGIGLAIVKKIAETHGGRVWVESDLGKGSRFHLTLPCDEWSG